MTKTEAYRLVYRFFMESGVLQKFFDILPPLKEWDS